MGVAVNLRRNIHLSAQTFCRDLCHINWWRSVQLEHSFICAHFFTGGGGGGGGAERNERTSVKTLLRSRRPSPPARTPWCDLSVAWATTVRNDPSSHSTFVVEVSEVFKLFRCVLLLFDKLFEMSWEEERVHRGEREPPCQRCSTPSEGITSSRVTFVLNRRFGTSNLHLSQKRFDSFALLVALTCALQKVIK